MDQTAKEPKSRVCPNCGALTPGDVAECLYCGHAPPEIVAARREEAKLHRFGQALFTRSTPFTFLFLGMNLGVFALMWMAGGMGAMAADLQVLIEFGAKKNELIAGQDQYWRLVTCIFIHIGFLHLFFNNYALWIVGREIELLYGSARFVILYLATGVAGSMGSYIFNPKAVSAGASGALFGLFGVLATFGFRYRKEIPDTISRGIRRQVIPLIIINLLFGFSVTGIDNAAHIGGLLTGIALTFVISYKRPQEKATPLVWRALMLVCLAIIFGSTVLAFRNYDGPRPSFANLTKSPGASVRKYVEEMGNADKSLRESNESLKSIIEKKDDGADSSAAMKAVERGIRSINETPQIEDEADRYRERLLALLTRQKEIIQRFSESDQKDWNKLIAEENAVVSRRIKLVEEINSWLPGFLEKHDLEVQEQPSGDKSKDSSA
ncbi:MAG: rhomboid family intramembrane serine protease [Blastocatellia bacterium]|nr:rhomboid family intramembrane serine protease [Blastocatellia bacterium]